MNPNNINVKYKLLIIALIVVFAYVYSIIFATHVTKLSKETNDKWPNKINDIHETCVMTCNKPFCQSACNFRGNNYYIGSDKKLDSGTSETCLVTFWSAGHFVLFMIIGFIMPELFIVALILGIGFEVYEYYRFDCHDPLDIIWNTSGFIVGMLLNKAFF